jgi:phage major head subunit gpT-like protein
MPAITPAFLFDLESNMRLITERQYQRLGSQLWWQKIAKVMPSQSKKERINWLLETAKIERTIKGGGQITFEDIVSQTTEFENENAAAGLKLKKEQLEDLDGNGVQLATHWSGQMGSYAAYWPQKMLAAALIANPTTYDAKAFFAVDHPVNPYQPGYGTFRNRFTSAASGIYPGAIPIDSSVTVDAAIANIAKAIAYIASLKMPNGEDPRFLVLDTIFVPPALVARAQQITNAKFIAQAAGSAAGSADVEAVVRNFGLGQPIEVPELGSAFGGSDTTYYLGMKEITSNELGAFVYVNREPFSVVYHGPQTDAELARMREFQWTTEGRNTVQPGHPYLLFRCEAT